jgi:hypothetical protein
MVCGWVVTPALAQAPRVGGPFAGLFGAKRDQQPGSTQTLDFRGSLFGIDQWTSIPASEDTLSLDPRYQEAGAFGGAAGSLAYSYTRRGQRSSFFGTGTATLADYSIDPKLLTSSFGASAGLTTAVTERIAFASSFGAGYSPSYGVGNYTNTTNSFVDQTVPGSQFGLAAIPSRNATISATASLTDNLSQRSHVVLSGDWRKGYLFDATAADVQGLSGQATFFHSLTRTLAVRVGYGRSVSTSTDPRTKAFTSDALDAGIDYGDTLRIARRTTLSFSTSSAVLRSSGGDPHFRINGNVSVTRNMRRSWSAGVSYVRSAEFLAGFSQPVLSDAVSGGFGGLLTRRLQWTNSGAWSLGQLGFENGGHFVGYTAASGLSLAIARQLAVFGSYGYYHYKVPPQSTTLDFLSRFSRQTVSVGLTVWVPIISPRRTERDPR